MKDTTLASNLKLTCLLIALAVRCVFCPRLRRVALHTARRGCMARLPMLKDAASRIAY